MVSNARLDLPEPDSPVTTTSRSRGISTEMFLRLCTRAPCTAMVARAAARADLGADAARLEGIGCFAEVNERQLLHACTAFLRESSGHRDLPDVALIGEVLARGRHAVD